MKKILVADDSAFMRRAMKKILTSQGHEVIGEAENGKIALEKYKELSPDIVTMDITMNEMTGLEALREILKFDAKAQIVMVSAMGQEPFVREALSLGAKGFMVKPFNTEGIASAISRLQ